MENLQPQLQTVIDVRDMPGEGLYAVSGMYLYQQVGPGSR